MSEEKETCHAEPQFVENTGSSASAPSKKKKFSRLWLLLLGVIAVIIVSLAAALVQIFSKPEKPVPQVPENIMAGMYCFKPASPADTNHKKHIDTSCSDW